MRMLPIEDALVGAEGGAADPMFHHVLAVRGALPQDASTGCDEPARLDLPEHLEPNLALSVMSME